MVFLLMTPMMVEALEKIQSLGSVAETDAKLQEAGPQTEDSLRNGDEQIKEGTKGTHGNTSAEPSLSNPQVGDPISHGQVIDLSRNLKTRGLQLFSLELLLKGSKVYIPPPQPKPEPTPEYKALMARLRREEEERSYERMTNPPLPMETFPQRFPATSAAHAFSSNFQPLKSSNEDDEVTYADIDRQMALILNVLLSIVACAGAIWVAARWWSTPARLALSMSGSLLVGVAEVVVYAGYIRRVSEAKKEEKAVKEVKEVVNTWVVGAGEDKEELRAKETFVSIESRQTPDDDVKARRRKKEIL